MTALSMYRGDSLTVTETIGPSGLDANGITNWLFWFTAKYDPSDADAKAVVKKVPTDFQVLNPGNATTAAVVYCNLASADTVSCPGHRVDLVFDVQAKDANGNVFTLDSGTLTVLPDVTQATS